MSNIKYECPACGNSETVVMQTFSLSDMIMRRRKCLVCGYNHKTLEARLDSGEAWKNIKNIISDAKSTNLP